VQLDGEVPDVRPGFTCTAAITTATRKQVLGVPIQALTVRERIVDNEGNIMPEPPAADDGSARIPAAPRPGESRKEFEGVFVANNGRASFVPVKTGIAGEKYFEVLEGLRAGMEVITGPFASVRTLRDGDPINRAQANEEATSGGGTFPPSDRGQGGNQ
jgi:HlyD family secretion protein